MTRACGFSRRLRRPRNALRDARAAAAPAGARVEPLEERIALAIFTVTNTADVGPGSLRQAVLDANALINSDDTIVFSAAFSAAPHVIDIIAPLPQFGGGSGGLTIAGPGSSLLTVRKTEFGPAVYRRVFDSFSPRLNLSGMTLTGGNLTGAHGAGLSCTSASNVTLDDMLITGNTANTNDGGGIWLSNNATLTLRNSVVTNNSARRGGGICYFDGGSLVMDNSTVSANTATGTSGRDVSGGGVYFAGAAVANPPAGFLPGTLLVRNSTISNNVAAGGGGGFGAENLTGTLLVRNSTISGNTAGSSGGGILQVAAPVTITLENSTVANNVAGGTVTGTNATGGGGICRVTSYPGTLNITSSIVSGNFNPLTPDILTTNTTTNVRYSAVGAAAGFTPSAASGSNLPYGANLLLGPLADNGGRTRTHAPLVGSPLVNAFAAAPVPADLPFDQRGPGFARVVGPAVDVGAVESTGTPSPVQVIGVYVRAQTWSPDFLNGLYGRGLGDALLGYAVAGGAAQLATVPWSGVNRISVRFNQPVRALGHHLAVTGANVPAYAATLTGYDAATYTATWTLAQAARNDRLRLDLDGDPGGVSGGATGAGPRLDGEWADGARPFPSGDGAAGGDFRFAVNVLPGDVDRANNRVNSIDVTFVRARQNRTLGEVTPPPGVQSYTPFADINGDGRINAVDVTGVRARLNNVLPPAPPVPLASPAPLFGDRPLRLDEDAGSILLG